VTIKEALDRAAETARLAAAEATVWDARILIAHSLGHSSPLALEPRATLPERAAARFEELWTLRLSGVPVQHLVGEWDFYGRSFRVDARGLVPRPETELVVSQALTAAPAARRVLDLGTGSGILAITLVQELPDARAVALDVSLDALALARENATAHAVLPRVTFAASDWLASIRGASFDLVVSNPPYLASADASKLPRTVLEGDPALALYGGDDGLACIRELLDAVPAGLLPGTPFLFEIGFGQAREVEREARARPAWRFEGIAADLAGIPRVTRLSRA
jgi:release factor glutamine methyltransferase